MPSLGNIIGQASRGADLYFVFRFLRLLTMKYEKTDAYKLGIIDKKSIISDISEADIILVSVPVKSIINLLPNILDKVNKNTLVIDFGSTTTDLICIKNSQMKCKSSDDFGRLNNS